MIRLVGFLLICLLLSACSKTYDSVKNQHIVKLKNSKNVTALLKKVKHKKITNNTYLIEGSIEVLQDSNVIEYSEPNYIWTIDSIPTDPKFDKLWGLHNKSMEGVDINAIKAWDITKGSRDIKVMVIDTGIDYNHPDLKDNMWINDAELNGEDGIDDDENGCIDDIHGCDYSNNDGDPIDDHGHGSHCAGTIGAVHNNDIGVAGVMADVELVACKFLASSGSGTTEGAIKCIDYGIKVGVNIMSNSWGGGPSSIALKEAIERARDAGIIFTAAAGNESSNNDNTPKYPANYQVENVISVAAYTASEEMSSFSCYGKDTVHIAAPGSNIYSTVKDGKYASYSGTSMATPHVSGVLGLLISHEKDLSFADIKERILMTSVPVRSFKRKLMTGGRIDAYNILMDIRPDRYIPDESKWQTVILDEVWESAHPYKNDEKIVKELKVPGAKYIRLIIKKMELEVKYDTIEIRNENEVYDSISGLKEDFKTEYVDGDTLIFKFKSDRSKVKWGFIIESYQFQ